MEYSNANANFYSANIVCYVSNVARSKGTNIFASCCSLQLSFADVCAYASRSELCAAAAATLAEMLSKRIGNDAVECILREE